MHELGILYHVVEQVEQVARENGVTEIEALVLQVGELASVVPRYLQECYPAAADGSILERAALEIETLPANVMCRSCSKVYPLPPDERLCPHCGSGDGEIISGTEFYIKEIRAR